jgi:ABC-2 type transport system ATP-binding protein
MQILKSPAVLALVLLLGACGGGGDSAGGRPAPGPGAVSGAFSRGALEYGAQLPVASCRRRQNLDGGRAYRVQIPSRVDGAAIVFQLFEPDHIDCGGQHPLVLEGHGYSGSRKTSKGGSASPLSIGADLAQLTAAGYAVISIDQRGHGESGGTIRVMDPDFEGEDLVAIVDWAEQHLDYLAYRGGNLLLGSTGGSYGGMFQYLLYGKDPDRRLDAMVPEIAPNNLTYSLNPNGVVKSYWALVLAGVGDANTGASQDPFIRSTLLNGAVTNEFPGAALPFFAYHSLSYFCDNPLGVRVDDDGDTSEYLLDPITGLLPITADGQYVVKTPRRPLYPVDALIFQGTRDDLFNFNEAYRNFQCLRRAGGDVRLLTYPFGHHFLSPNLGLLAEGVNAQALPLSRNCGPINASDAALAFFNEKLKGVGNTNRVVTTGHNVCFSLTEGDAVSVPQVTVGGTEFPLALPGGAPVPVTIGNPVPVIVPLATAGEGGEVIAGIPTARITVSRGDAALDALCQSETDPILRLGTCDATVFLGLGVIKTGALIPLVPELIDEQVIPVRGIGEFDIELVGVAERIAAGDQIVLLVYGLQDAYAFTTSRDLLTPLVTVSGTVKLPLLGALPNITQ